MKTTKRCSKCKQNKPVSVFHKDKFKKDGLHSWCKQCQNQFGHKGENKQYQQQYHNRYYKTLRGYLKYVWCGMLHRCTNPKYRDYKYYGARGIQIKFTSFEDFYDYVINELKTDPRGLTIDRIDNDGHYEKRNIRFVSQAENNRNRL